MNQLIFFFLMLISTASCGYAKINSDICPSCFIAEKIPHHNLRFKNYTKAIELMRDRDVKVIVETGTAKNGDKNCLGDGCSTLIFGAWAKEHGAVLYSVDIDLECLKIAEEALGNNASCVNFIHDDAISFLKNFNQPIDLLYLDSNDYYIDNPRPAQLYRLFEIKAAYPWLTEDSIVIIDDCNLPNGGSGSDAIEFLLDKGWTIYQNGHQVIMLR